jgi:hypothetical protein
MVYFSLLEHERAMSEEGAGYVFVEFVLVEERRSE